MAEESFFVATEEETLEKPLSKLQVMQCVQPNQYNINYCKTSYTSSKFTYTWEINNFPIFYKTLNTLTSPPFPETSNYTIQIKASQEDSSESSTKNVISFYVCAKKPVTAISTILISSSHPELNATRIGLLSGTTLLYATEESLLQPNMVDSTYTLTMHFTFEILHEIMNVTSHVNETLVSKNPKAGNIHNILNSGKTKSLTFVVRGKEYSVPIHLLRATGSVYFDILCTKYEEKDESTMDTVTINDKPTAFCQLLLFITDEILPDSNDYRMLLELMTVAYTYNVRNLVSICEQLLLRHVTMDTVIDVMDVALTCEAEYLIQCALDFIKLHNKQFSRILYTENPISEENSKKIIELMSQNELTQHVIITVSCASYQEPDKRVKTFFV